MAVQNEIWTRYIINRLWKDNQFLTRAYNEDQYVQGGSIVHIINPGAKPAITKNLSSFPAAAVQRADTDITYALDAYTSAPTHIRMADLGEITYPKIESVIGDHAGELVEFMADDMIIKWLTGIAAPNIVRTSGTAAAAKVTGQTGTRNIVVVGDIKRLQLRMNLDNVPKNDRCVMLESNQMDEFTDGLSINQNREFSDYYDAKSGVVGRLFGFDFYERSRVAIASAALAIDPIGAAVDGTDHVVSLAWQKDCVTRAIGERKFFEDVGNPLYYGDIYSALIRAGGRRRRGDNAGVVALIQQ